MNWKKFMCNLRTRGARAVAIAFSSIFQRLVNLDFAEHAKGAIFAFIRASERLLYI